MWSILSLQFVFSGKITYGGHRRAPVDPQLDSWVPEAQPEISLDTSMEKNVLTDQSTPL